MSHAVKIIKTYWPVPACMLLAAFFVYFPITDADIFWHLAAGKEMVTHRHFLYADPFAYTLASPPWINLHWLFQLCMYGLYSAGGAKALILFKLSAVAGVAALLCLTHHSRWYVLFSAFLAAVLFYEARYLIDLRPVLITMLCMAAYVFLFEHVREKGKTGLLWLCLPLQIIWTNSQGLYVIGLFIIAAYWAEGLLQHFFRHTGRKPMAETALLLLCAVSCLINPYGIAALQLPLELFSRIAPVAKNIYSLNISENVPLFSLAGHEAVYRTTVIVTAVMACLLFILCRKRIRLAHIVLFAGFLLLAVSAVRNVPLYIVIIVPIIGYYADSLRAEGLRSMLPTGIPHGGCIVAMAAVLFSALAVPLVRHISIVKRYPPHRTLSPFRFPEKVTAAIKHNPVPGNMFNDIRYGGYLLWHLYPEKKVFIDTRLVIRSPEFFMEYCAISDRPELFPGVAEKFNITHAVLPSALFTRHLKLIRWLYTSGEWHLEYTDGASVFFVRNDIPDRPMLDLSNHTTVQNIVDSIRAQWRDAPAVRREALGYFGDLLEHLDLHEAAVQVHR